MGSHTFCLDNYDSIGFDLDCTLAEYNVPELMKLVYNSLADFLITKKNYDRELFENPYEENEYFLQKGLFMDLSRGNILKLNENGVILKATHGTNPMTEAEIQKLYGSKSRSETFSHLQEFVSDPLAMIHKYGKVLRASLDCFDMPCVLLFARLVDQVDLRSGHSASDYNIWPDIVAGLFHLYSSEHFLSGDSEFFTQLRKNPALYYYKWTSQKLQWMKELKSKKFTFLITGSFIGFASHTATYCIGEDWRDYFDAIVTYARKPYFFSQSNPFVRFENERGEIVLDDLQVNTVYCQGNWKKLKALISKETHIEEPKCLYVGDNLIQDIYASAHFGCCDSIAVSVELKNEFRPSEMWGSYFRSQDGISYWNRLLKGNALCCISSVDVMMCRPITYQYTSLKGGKSNEVDETHGYYVQ